MIIRLLQINFILSILLYYIPMGFILKSVEFIKSFILCWKLNLESVILGIISAIKYTSLSVFEYITTIDYTVLYPFLEPTPLVFMVYTALASVFIFYVFID